MITNYQIQRVKKKDTIQVTLHRTISSKPDWYKGSTNQWRKEHKGYTLERSVYWWRYSWPILTRRISSMIATEQAEGDFIDSSGRRTLIRYGEDIVLTFFDGNMRRETIYRIPVSWWRQNHNAIGRAIEAVVDNAILELKNKSEGYA